MFADSSTATEIALASLSGFVAAAVTGLVGYLVARTQIRAQEQIAAKQIDAQGAITREQIKEEAATQRKSANRMRWINDVRDAVSELASYLWTIPIRKTQPLPAVEDARQAQLLLTKLALLLNPYEGETTALMDALERYSTAMDRWEPGSELPPTGDLVNAAKQILKQEWEKVKAGT